MCSGLALFDLDGTLVDPAGAITGGIADALRAHDLPVPDDERLRGLVGPPLAEGLAALPGVTQEVVPSLMQHYREGYRDHGMATSRVYPGIRDLLGSLREQGVPLAVATSKPEPLARQLLDIQQLAPLFDVISGADPDDTTPHPGKEWIIASALERLSVPVDMEGRPDPGTTVVMIGDRRFDVEGAARLGIPCIGVGWGYAPDGELTRAGAVSVVDTVERLGDEIAQLLGAQRSTR
jgi:phosphoglycolate phosphatase